MATGYHIRRGYNSAHQPDEVEGKLREVVTEICREPSQDLTIKFVENEEDGLMLMQMASGGGTDRDNKEAMRRAVCRMVMERMHAAGMEISVSVA